MLTRLLIILTLCCPIVSAADPPSPGSGAAGTAPSDASIKQLLEVTRTHKMLDSTMAQMNALMTRTMQQVTQGQKITPQIQKDIDKRQSEMMATIKELLDWNKLEPMYVRIYQKSFTQQEVDGMIGFYKTSSGQALINKMPVVLQNTLNEMQQMMAPMMQRMRQDQQEVSAEIKAESEKNG
jgi:hypothetical protein